jgi:hypothetical protein
LPRFCAFCNFVDWETDSQLLRNFTEGRGWLGVFMFNKRVDGLGSPNEPLWEREANRRNFGRNRRKRNGVFVVQGADFLDFRRLPIITLIVPEWIEIG